MEWRDIPIQRSAATTAITLRQITLPKAQSAAYTFNMDKITRNVRDLKQDERRVYEAALGERLRENQQVVLQVVTPTEPKPAEGAPLTTATAQLPDWCNIYEGLSDEEIAEIEEVILDRSGWNRNSQ
jgi:hypothetical protein